MSIVDLDPDDAATYYNRGNAYQNQNEHDLALDDYTHAITLNNEYAEAYSNRGYIYTDTGHYKQAIADFTRAIELNPDFDWFYINRIVASLLSTPPECTLAAEDLTQVAQFILDNPNLLTLLDYYNEVCDE